MHEKKARKYDVAVVGGGIAGIAAALSAARQDKKVLLVESSYIVGGLATSGIVTIYLPLCDGEGRQLSYGIAEELLRLSVSRGADADYPYAWFDPKSTVEMRRKNRYSTRFNPNVFAILAEKLLKENGVDILYGATLFDVKKNRVGNKIVSVSLVTKTDAYEVSADAFIDCTGDATVFSLAGAPTALAEHKNADASWYYEVSGGQYRLKMLGSSDYVYKDGGAEGISGLDGEENSAEVVKSHAAILEDFFRKGEVSPYHSVATVPTIPQLRMTRRIKGVSEMKKSDDKKYVPSSVGAFGSWLERGPAYELPLETLYCAELKNLCCAGRCISVSDDDMWDITRVIPVCAVTGEAAGILAAESRDFPNVDPKKVQRVLKKRKIKFHLSDLGIENK